jgi:O-antigen/teichoic acid export membrane protein
MLPLGSIADSFIVVNNLSSYTENATSLFGIYSGSVAAIVGLPISVAYGVAVATVPAIAGGGGEKEVSESLKLTAFVAVPSSVFFVFFAPSCVKLLYGGMTEFEQTIASQVLSLDAVSVISLAFLQTVNSLLISSGKQKIPVYSMLSALVLRVALCLWFTSYPQIGIQGAVISSNLSYLLALGISCRFALKKEVLPFFIVDFAKCFLCAIMCVLVGFMLQIKLEGKVWFVVISLFVATLYVVLSKFLGIVDLFSAIKRNKKVKAI